MRRNQLEEKEEEKEGKTRGADEREAKGRMEVIKETGDKGGQKRGLLGALVWTPLDRCCRCCLQATLRPEDEAGTHLESSG